jgi:hypothetical protein
MLLPGLGDEVGLLLLRHTLMPEAVPELGRVGIVLVVIVRRDLGVGAVVGQPRRRHL